ncbi:MAG TPA: PilZ domain-containing protein [Gemmataceae bacterium]|jgi:hypothetical protein|nr:PilZ domain-containing protein [Gemmataceae bacterium]
MNSARPDNRDFVLTEERRAWVRYPSSQTTLCQERTAQTYDLWFMARVCDISPNGIRLLLGHTFTLGDTVSIEPIRTKEPFGRALEARVIYANEEKRGAWIIGCEFVVPLSDDELDTLTQPDSWAVTQR